MSELIVDKDYWVTMRLPRNNPSLTKNLKNENLFDGEVEDETV